MSLCNYNNRVRDYYNNNYATFNATTAFLGAPRGFPLSSPTLSLPRICNLFVYRFAMLFLLKEFHHSSWSNGSESFMA